MDRYDRFKAETDATIFQRIPILADCHPVDFEITRLAGLSNKNYCVKNSTVELILRIPTLWINLTIYRDNEAYNSAIAVQLDLAPPCLWHNDHGESLTQAIRHSKS